MIRKQYISFVAILTILLSMLILLPSICLAQDDVWVKKSNMPIPRYYLGTAAVNGKIYVIGGWDTFKIHGTVEEYDPATDTWTRKADMPTPRDMLSVIAVNGKIYALGGLTPTKDTGYFELTPNVEEYDPITDTWTRKADIPTQRWGLTTSVVNGKIYAIGGLSAFGMSIVEEYDPVTDKWTRKKDMPTPRTRLSTNSPAVNGKIYVIGGLLNYIGFSTPNVEEYDPVTDTWTRKADMPTSRGVSTIEVNGKIYAIGGARDFDGNTTTMLYGNVEEYDPITDKWIRKSDMLIPRGACSVNALNGVIYIIGGVNFNGMVSTVEAYYTDFGPRVKTVSPLKGLESGNESITILGDRLPADTEVTIGGKAVKIISLTDKIIIGATSPNPEGEYDVWVNASSFEHPILAGRFSYNKPSAVFITRIEPDNGKLAGGGMVSILGSGFLPGANVTIDGNPATNITVTPTFITFKIPPGTEGKRDIVVINPDGQKSTLKNGYTYNPFPIIDRILPVVGGPLNGGTNLTIKGKNFIQGAFVYIGDNRIFDIDFFSTTEIRFRTPSGTEGMKSIRIVNPDGQEAIKANGFVYNLPPKIISIEPNAGALEGGTRVIIKGENFNVSQIFIGTGFAYILYMSSDSITVVTPPSSSGTKDVVVENSDEQESTLENAFTYNFAPTITNITPNNGKLSGGVKITIQGNGFMPEAKVFIGLGQDTVTTVPIWSWEYVSPTMMTALLPSSKESKIVSIVVVNPDDQKAILKDCFMYNSIPTITSVQPDNGPSSGGTTLVIKGSGFLPGAKVQVGYGLVSAIVKDDSTIEAITPSGQPGKFSVGVINPDTQSVFRSDSFIYIGKMAYNYPNPFRASQGTTFRYVSKDKVSSIEVRIFNTGGVPIDIVQADGTNEVKWRNPSLQTGIYIYLMEVVLDDGKKENHKGVLEVY